MKFVLKDCVTDVQLCFVSNYVVNSREQHSWLTKQEVATTFLVVVVARIAE